MRRERGKYNKRGGRGSGRRNFQVTSADEIELRNARIAEFDERRASRRYNKSEVENDNIITEEDLIESEEETDVTSGRIDLNMNMLSMNDTYDNSFSNDYDGLKPQLTRKQREALEKEKAEQEYRRRHALGLTEEYKRDMEKLAEVKKRREIRAKELQQAKEEEETFRSMKDAYLGSADCKVDPKSKLQISENKEKKKMVKELSKKLDKITIKKMKPTQLKESLKQRGLDIQGNAKVLTQRLLDYEVGL